MNCPLCDKELKYNHSSNYYWCEGTWYVYGRGMMLNHYLKEMVGVTECYVNHYRVTDFGDHMIIWTLNEHDNWKRILKTPHFQIPSSDQLLQKIKTLLTFS